MGTDGSRMFNNTKKGKKTLQWYSHVQGMLKHMWSRSVCIDWEPLGKMRIDKIRNIY